MAAKIYLRASSVVLALLIAGATLLGTTYAANRFFTSEVYSKSRLISMIVTQDGISLTDMASNKRSVDIMLKFVSALTSAYIDFELIPVGEVATFTVVLESLPPNNVTVEKFEYHRKNLTILGSADTEQDYDAFVSALQDADYFQEVVGDFYPDAEGTLHFELECISQTVQVLLDL